MLRGGRGLFLAENAHQKINLCADVHEAQQQGDPDDENNRPETNVCFDWRFFIGSFHAIAFPDIVRRQYLLLASMAGCRSRRLEREIGQGNLPFDYIERGEAL